MSARRQIVLVLGFALLLRLFAYALFGGILHADEIYQYAEQAHRLVFGQGVVPWEYRAGIRSWLFPGLLAGVMEAARPLGSGPVVQNAAVAAFLSLLSLPGVACCMLWGRRAAGAAGGLAAGVLAAGWSENVLISIHPLLDGVGADCLVPGVFLLERAASGASRAGLLRAGALLGLTLAVRLQLAPAVFWAWLRLCGTRPRSAALPTLAGMAVPVLLSGLLDWITLGSPFRSIIGYVTYNNQGAADYFGVDPWFHYGHMLLWATQWLFPLLAVCACMGAARLPLLLELAAIILLSFSAVPHKEFRFILPALPFLLTLTGVGIAAMAARLRRPYAVGAACMLLCLVHPFLAGSTQYWLRGQAMVAEMHRAAADPAACALAMVSPKSPSILFLAGGTTHLRPGMQLVSFDPDTPKGHIAGFDYAIAPVTISLAPWGMTQIECRPAPQSQETATAFCLWHNPNGCDGTRLPPLHLPDPPFFTLRPWPPPLQLTTKK